jgi:hypothetical protein
MSESKRLELRQTYGKGWDTWDADLLCSSLAEGFYFDDPALKEPVTIESIPEYMDSWKDRVKALGGTGVITSRDRVVKDVDGAYITWHWWGFEGTNYEGSAVTRTTDRGVEYERITYYPDTPKFE